MAKYGARIHKWANYFLALKQKKWLDVPILGLELLENQ
jgi:hypothetical protein